LQHSGWRWDHSEITREYPPDGTGVRRFQRSAPPTPRPDSPNGTKQIGIPELPHGGYSLVINGGDVAKILGCVVILNDMAIVKKAIILAGGKGTRLYPVTLETPKPLLTVNKKPIINYLIDMFRRHGVTEIAVTVRESDFDDFSWWLRRWQNNLVNLIVEKEPMGTFGLWAHQLHTWTGNEPFFLTNGDELKDINLFEMTAHHEKIGGLATIAAVEVPNPNEYGVIVFDGQRIKEFLEKPEHPPTKFISSGLYILEPGIREMIADKVKSGEKFLMIEKDLFPKLAAEKKLAAYRSKGKWFDCGNLERWEKAIKEWGPETK